MVWQKDKELLSLMEVLVDMKVNGEREDMMDQLCTFNTLQRITLWPSMKEVGLMELCKEMECFLGPMEATTVVIGLMERDKDLENTLNLMEQSKKDGGKMTYSQVSQMKC